LEAKFHVMFKTSKDSGLNPETGDKRRVSVLSFFSLARYGYGCSAFTLTLVGHWVPWLLAKIIHMFTLLYL